MDSCGRARIRLGSPARIGTLSCIVSATHLYLFGPFKVDPGKEILSREGVPVPLTPRAFQILLVLLERAPEAVTKDEMMRAVWADTFVEEANLSRNIFLLRKALGESPQDHRYVLTLPGRGYRFAEPVRTTAPDADAGTAPAGPVAASAATPEARSEWWRRAGIAAALLLVVSGAVYWSRVHGAPVLNARDTVVLADFANSTGDQVFDETLRQGLAVQLEQSPFLRLISEERIQQALRLMGQPAGAALSSAVALGVCQRTSGAAVVEGSIARLGSEYVLGLRLRNCRTGDVLRESQAQARHKEDVLSALSAMARDFRKQIGESGDTLQKFDTPIADATTPSFDALKAYSTGLKVLYSSGSAAALPFFQHAIEIDPKFAMAHAFLGRMYGDLGEFDESADSTARAYASRDHTSEHERFLIASSYDLQVTGNLEKAARGLRVWEESYPRDPIPHGFLSGIIYPNLGRYAEAVTESRLAIDLDPSFGVAYAIRAYALAGLDRYDEADGALRAADAQGIRMPDFAVERYDLAFLEGDEAALRAAAAAASVEPGADAWVTNHEAFVAAYRGRMRDAHRLNERAVALAEQVGEHERAAQFAAGEAVRNAFIGDFAAARTGAETALARSRDRDVEYGAALALAMLGEVSKASGLLADLEKRFPEDTSARFNYCPSIRAAIALQRGNPSAAIEALQVNIPYELGAPRSSQHAFFGALYPVYLRGEAYLALENGPAAEAEFRKIIAHRGIVISDVIGALAHLQQARARARSHDSDGARAAYQAFLTLWKYADEDLPILARAKHELAAVANDE
jgi:DNA-binding winged helix-turn-helix (wHTH) protein